MARPVAPNSHTNQKIEMPVDNGKASPASPGLRIVNAEVHKVAGLDVRCRDGRVTEIGHQLAPAPGEEILNARGGAVLPGLHDHHIHLFALAAAARSVQCGPPQVCNREQLRLALSSAPGEHWIRGIGYHESVAGMLDRRRLDALCHERPARIQHRSGKMWFLNSPAARLLGVENSDGRLFRQDEWLREQLADDADLDSALASTGRRLASHGVTGITETTPSNDTQTLARYRRQPICLRINFMGNESLTAGCLKIMLDDYALPGFQEFRDRLASAHQRHRPVAIHCVTRTELIFALSALGEVGTIPGDRIEHAAVTDAAALQLFRETPGDPSHLSVVTQPNFIAERGDRYLKDVATTDHDHLYRCRGFLTAGIPIGGGTDAPFGDPDPWAAMDAAVTRKTRAGAIIGAAESLTPEQALDLFTTPLDAPGGPPRQVTPGVPADLCVLHKPWAQARLSLSRKNVAATVMAGAITYRDKIQN